MKRKILDLVLQSTVPHRNRIFRKWHLQKESGKLPQRHCCEFYLSDSNLVRPENVALVVSVFPIACTNGLLNLFWYECQCKCTFIKPHNSLKDDASS